MKKTKIPFSKKIHDINNVLASVSLMTELLLMQEFKTKTKLKKHVQHMLSELKKMRNMISKLKP